MTTVGERIKAIRLNLGQTMEEFGAIFNTSKGTVNNWEKNRNLPNKRNLARIASLGGITPIELVKGDGLNFVETKEYVTELLNSILEQDNDDDFNILNFKISFYLKSEDEEGNFSKSEYERHKQIAIDKICDYFLENNLNYRGHDEYLKRQIIKYLNKIESYDNTQDGAIRYAIKKLYNFYTSELLDFFFDKKDNRRKGMTDKFYDEISKPIKNAIDELNELLQEKGFEKYDPNK